ncbi:MAG: WbqC-like family protein [Flavipsychrobacter sp.]|nr:WbqC-like family protein [Flavipsychrobacter sp.]
MTVVSPFLTFPNISWWAQVISADTIILDAGEYFQKMSGRNRYDIAGANNSIKLSIPLVNGRNQHIPVSDVQVHNGDRWQTQHWRTLVSVYNRSPYFEHFAPTLQQLYETEFTHLTAFNKASMLWVIKQLKIKAELQDTTVYVKEYPQEVTDLRSYKRDENYSLKYHQVFEDRIGFLPDLSILDLLFSEGPVAGKRLIG